MTTHATIAYQPGTADDLFLAEWYMHLRDTGDLFTVFFSSMHSLSTFLLGWRESELVLDLVDQKVWAAVWVQKIHGAPFVGVWVDEADRGSLDAGKFFLTQHGYLREAYPQILCVTRQPDMVALSLSLGYTNHGLIPALWEGEPAYLLSSNPTEEVQNGQGRRRQSSGSSTPLGGGEVPL